VSLCKCLPELTAKHGLAIQCLSFQGASEKTLICEKTEQSISWNIFIRRSVTWSYTLYPQIILTSEDSHSPFKLSRQTLCFISVIKWLAHDFALHSVTYLMFVFSNLANWANFRGASCNSRIEVTCILFYHCLLAFTIQHCTTNTSLWDYQ
jgi:hypothetical protein